MIVKLVIVCMIYMSILRDAIASPNTVAIDTFFTQLGQKKYTGISSVATNDVVVVFPGNAAWVPIAGTWTGFDNTSKLSLPAFYASEDKLSSPTRTVHGYSENGTIVNANVLASGTFAPTGKSYSFHYYMQFSMSAANKITNILYYVDGSVYINGLCGKRSNFGAVGYFTCPGVECKGFNLAKYLLSFHAPVFVLEVILVGFCILACILMCVITAACFRGQGRVTTSNSYPSTKNQMYLDEEASNDHNPTDDKYMEF